MIAEFVKRWDARKDKLAAHWAKDWPGHYGQLVEDVVRIVLADDYEDPDPGRIAEVNHGGGYQGTLIYVIASGDARRHWVVAIAYGSCSACDSLQAITRRLYTEDGDEYIDWDEAIMTLALHVVQRIKEVC